MLPKLDVPLYDFEIPSSGKTIKFRPFSVKEQKLLLMANESKDEKTVYDTIKQIVENCVVSDGFKAESFASFDLEYFFLQLRIRSIGETLNLSYTCNNDVDGKPCGQPLKFDYDLREVKVSVPAKDAKKIFLTDTVGFIMKYPGLDLVKLYEGQDKEMKLANLAFELVIACIDYVFDGDKVTSSKDIDKVELEDFIEKLPSTDFEKLVGFLSNMPSVSAQIEHDCPKCNFHHSVKVEGLTSFFG